MAGRGRIEARDQIVAECGRERFGEALLDPDQVDHPGALRVRAGQLGERGGLGLQPLEGDLLLLHGVPGLLQLGSGRHGLALGGGEPGIGGAESALGVRQPLLEAGSSSAARRALPAALRASISARRSPRRARRRSSSAWRSPRRWRCSCRRCSWSCRARRRSSAARTRAAAAPSAARAASRC